MIIKYRIHWLAVETNATGHGQPVFNTREMAERSAKAPSDEVSLFLHWVEPVEVEGVIKAPEQGVIRFGGRDECKTEKYK